MRCTRQLRQNLLLHFAEQPRFMAYKLLQLTVEVRSSEGSLCMAAPLQRSGEYDVFLKMSLSALDQRWTWTLVMSSCRLNVRIPLTHRTCRTGHQPGFSRPPSMAERRAECRFRSLGFLCRRRCRMAHCLSMQPPALERRSAVYKAQSLGSSLIHMIPAPHQRLPCLEDTALLFTRYQPPTAVCRV